jgi:hypothetical protein
MWQEKQTRKAHAISAAKTEGKILIGDLKPTLNARF